jgi:hypothetical protein
MKSSENVVLIDVAKEFTAMPYGRYLADDANRSAEAFRKNILVPALKSGDSVVVDLSGSNRFNSSFLEEAFGGLIRTENFTKEQLSKMTVKHALLPSIVDEVAYYIDSAIPESES